MIAKSMLVDKSSSRAHRKLPFASQYKILIARHGRQEGNQLQSASARVLSCRSLTRTTVLSAMPACFGWDRLQSAADTETEKSQHCSWRNRAQRTLRSTVTRTHTGNPMPESNSACAHNREAARRQTNEAPVAHSHR